MNDHRNARQRARAERVYRWVLRGYPAAHRRTYGAQMRLTFLDHYRDAVEMQRESALRFWCGVASDTGKSLIQEHVVAITCALRERMSPMKSVLAVTLTVVGVLLLLGLRVWLYPAVLSAPHGGGSAVSSVVGVAILVAVYALGAVAILRGRHGAGIPERVAALRRATRLGALVGACVLGAIAVDTLLSPESPIGLGAWAVVILAAAIGWGLAGQAVTRAGGSRRLGVVAALWSGMVTALMGAAGEVASTLIALPRLAQNELSNPDYLYWHQPDVQSYAIASALALGMIGLILAPIAASIIGGIGGWLGRSGSLMSPRENAALR